MLGVVHSFDFQPFIITSSRQQQQQQQQQQVLCVKNKTRDFNPHRCCVVLQNENPFPKIIASTNPSSFTVDYLVNSCGLSPKTAQFASTKVNLTSPERPNSVLTLFLNYGFTRDQIAEIVSKRPEILLSSPDRTLKPKLEYFHGLGVPDSDIGCLMATTPAILHRSLSKQIVPSFNFLKSYLGSYENALIIRVYRRYKWVINDNILKLLEVNIEILRDFGVPEYSISKFLIQQTRTLGTNTDRFREIVKKVAELGFDPTSLTFYHAVRSMASLSKENWDKKVLFLQSFGWSKAEVLAMFKKQPLVMTYSEENITRKVKFFVEKLNWTLDDISYTPSLLFLSLEKRIIPRSAVFEVLASAGVKVNLSPALRLPERQFFDRYVIRYRKSVPGLMDAYHSEAELAGLQSFTEVGDIEKGNFPVDPTD